jgi:hypothetical protein
MNSRGDGLRHALGTLAAACGRTVVLTGWLLGGYADELFNILYRPNPRIMREDGFDHGQGGLRQFAEAYGVLEKVTTMEASETSFPRRRWARR